MTDAVRSRIRHANDLPDKAAARILFEIALEHDSAEDDPGPDNFEQDGNTFETFLNEVAIPQAIDADFGLPDNE